MPEPRRGENRIQRPVSGKPPENLPVAPLADKPVFDTTPVESVVAELLAVRTPETVQQSVDASLSAAEALLVNESIVRNDAAYGAAVRLAQRLEEYLVAPVEDGAEAGSATRAPSVFARALLAQNDSVENTVLYTDFVIEINQCVRAIARAVEERVDETASQRVHGTLSFDVVAQYLRVGNAEHRPEDMATAMQMPTETIFAYFPELLQNDFAMQRTIPLQNPFAPQYAQYWEERRRATAIVQGTEHPREDELPALSELIAGRGEHAALLLTEEQEGLEGDEYEDVCEAITVLVDFLDQTSADIEDIPAGNQAELAKRLVQLNILRERPENAIALLNACEVVKQHNPELFFRILGVSTGFADGTAIESDLFGNPLMIALDQTNRDLESRKTVSPGVVMLRDRVDTLLSADARRSPLPYLNEQQLRAAEQALQESLKGTGGAQGPNIFATTMLLKYTPVLELGKLMREVGFERRGEYVDRIRNGMPREIIADLMDMPEMLLEDPEVIAAWRERYDLDHPDVFHRYAMRYALDVQWYHDATTMGSVRKDFQEKMLFPDAHEETNNPLPYHELDISDEKLIRALQFRKKILEKSRDVIVQNRGVRGRLFGVSKEEIVDTLMQDPSLGTGGSDGVFIQRLRASEYIANSHAFIVGLWAHAPKELYSQPGVVGQMITDLDCAINAATVHDLYRPENPYTFGPLQFALSVLPQEDWVGDSDWREVYYHNVASRDVCRKVLSQKSVQDLIAHDPYIRPGRLFAGFLEMPPRFKRSLLEIVRLQSTVSVSTEQAIHWDSLYTWEYQYDLTYTGLHLPPASAAVPLRFFEFIDDVQMLTPVERELHDLIEPIMIKRLQSEIRTEIQRQVNAYISEPYQSLVIREQPSPDEALLVNCIRNMRPKSYQDDFRAYIKTVIENVEPGVQGERPTEDRVRLLKIRQRFTKLLFEGK